MTRRSFGVGVVIILGIVLRVAAFPPGFSYSKFSGPVSPPEHEIIVEGEHGKPAVDYVAFPKYQFEYGIEDAKSRVKQSRKEERHGDEVIGEYSVVEPDGSLRTVKYRADKENGFQAQVYMDGKLVEYGNTGSDESGEGGGYKVSHGTRMGQRSSEENRWKSDEDESGDEDDDDDDEDED